MSIKNTFKGVVAPMITPFLEDGNFDEKSAVRISEFLLEGGMSIFLLGTTGEALSMNIEMRYRFVEHVMKKISNPGIVYVGISDHALGHNIDAAKRFYDLGVSAFVAHLPSYYPLTPDAMLAYYEKLADAVPGPVMLYNVPGTTKLSIPLDVIEKLSPHPNIIGLKDSGRDLERMQTLVDKFRDRDDFVLMCGWTVKSTETLLMGFDGIVPSTGNVIPGRFKKLYDAIQEGDESTARELQLTINPLAELHQKDRTVSQAIAGTKVMMNEMGLCGTTVLPPLMPCDAEEERRLRKGLRLHGVV